MINDPRKAEADDEFGRLVEQAATGDDQAKEAILAGAQDRQTRHALLNVIAGRALDRGYLLRALRLADEILESAPEDVAALFTHSEAHFLRGNIPQATEGYRKILALDKGSIVASMVRQRLGQLGRND